MRFSKYSKTRGQYETLEAKTLFAADLMGGAAIDLPDTAFVAGLEHSDHQFGHDLRCGYGGPDSVQSIPERMTVQGVLSDENGPVVTGVEGGGAVDHNSTRSNRGIVGDGGGGTTGIESDFETDNPEGSNPTPHPMPVPELSDSVSKHRLEHGPGMYGGIWTDGTMTNLSEFPAKTSLDADGVDHNSTRSNNGIVGEGGEQHKIYDYSQRIWNDITFNCHATPDARSDNLRGSVTVNFVNVKDQYQTDTCHVDEYGTVSMAFKVDPDSMDWIDRVKNQYEGSRAGAKPNGAVILSDRSGNDTVNWNINGWHIENFSVDQVMSELGDQEPGKSNVPIRTFITLVSI